MRCRFCYIRRLQFFLLPTSGSLVRLFSVESFECFLQEDPRYFEGVPLGYKEFVFDVPFHTTGNVAEPEMVDLSESKGLKYPYEIFFFGLATFTRGEIGVQGVRCFGSEF